MVELMESPPMAERLNREKMRSLRKSLELTQAEAAKRADLPGGNAYWSDIESGKRPNVTLDTLYSIASALECQPADLLVPPEPPRGKKRGR